MAKQNDCGKVHRKEDLSAPMQRRKNDTTEAGLPSSLSKSLMSSSSDAIGGERLTGSLRFATKAAESGVSSVGSSAIGMSESASVKLLTDICK